jgi:hypothetical protein
MNKAGVPVVCDVKDQWPDYFLTAIPKKLKPIGRIVLSPLFLLGKSTLRNASGISSISEQFLDWSVKRAGRKQTDIDLVAPLVSRNVEVSPSNVSIAKDFWDKLGLDDDYQFRACYIGSLSPSCNFDFLEHLDKSSTWQFVICGTGSQYEPLKEKFRNHRNIIFPGWIDLTQAAHLTSVSNLGLVPYHSEKSFEMSIPNKIYDYLRSGLPILSSLNGVTEKLLQSNLVGFTYKSFEDFANVLADLEKWDELKKSDFSERCKLLASTQFSYESVYGRYISHLEKLAELPRR